MKCVISSGSDRWFQNSEVVTNVLILEKKAGTHTGDGQIKFVVLRKSLDGPTGKDSPSSVAAQIKLGQVHTDAARIRTVETDRLVQFDKYGLAGNAQFVDVDWVLHVPLTYLKKHFHIRRGERRGLNALFYPGEKHGIEAEYIRPLAKSSENFTQLTGQATHEAFSCSRTIEELHQLGHHGALQWISRFKTPENIQRLSSGKNQWYEMKADRLAELVMSINPGDRLFVGRLDPPAFADQRFVRLASKSSADIALFHALMNSTIGMFLIEGLGFGRGLGALDLNKDRIEARMHVLDPSIPESKMKIAVLDAFSPLLRREILSVSEELEQADRQAFDNIVIRAFGLQVERQRIYDSLHELVSIRLAAKGKAV